MVSAGVKFNYIYIFLKIQRNLTYALLTIGNLLTSGFFLLSYPILGGLHGY